MSDIQFFLTDSGIEVNVDPIFNKKFNDCYGAEFNVDELIFMLSKLGVDVKKLQEENEDLQGKLEDEGFVLVLGRDEAKELEHLRKENAELKSCQLKDGDIVRVVNGVRLAVSEVWGNPPQSLREIISKAVIRNLPTPQEGE